MEQITQTSKEKGHIGYWELAQFFLSFGIIKPESFNSNLNYDPDVDDIPLQTDTVTEHMLKMRDRFA
jgi:hypothetical protein